MWSSIRVRERFVLALIGFVVNRHRFVWIPAGDPPWGR
jgi:hypothetical protein